MIHRISANKASFRTVTFEAGLNVIVAERTDVSSQKDTRNGLGKSTLIDVIDFCLGGSSNKGKKLNVDALQDWEFTMDVTLAQNRIQVTRAVSSASRIVIAGSTEGWPDPPTLDEETGEYFYNLTQWRAFLGWALFDLTLNDETSRYTPSYRSAISYFIRTKPGAYLDPFKYIPQQAGITSQVNVAYLLGLSWETASKLKELEEDKNGIAALESGHVTGVRTIGELEAKRVRLREQTTREEEAVQTFNVHPQYADIQSEADQLTKQLHDLANQNVTERRKLSRYMESMDEEEVSTAPVVESLYEECGLVFNDSVKRALSDAKTFHGQVVKNRREFLEIEVEKLKQAIAERDIKTEALVDKRKESLEILQTHGALLEMAKLQERCSVSRGDLDRVEASINELKGLKSRKREIKEQKSEAVKVAELDYEDRRAIWEKAIALFNDNSLALYEAPGELVINIDENGYKFRVEIKRDGSDGVGKMKIFCFDLVCLQMQIAAEKKGGFLIHDSIMYDGVDPRQRAKALELAAQATESSETQYICTLNSDMIPFSDFSEEFDFNHHVRLTLTDETPAGSLFGLRFER